MDDADMTKNDVASDDETVKTANSTAAEAERKCYAGHASPAEVGHISPKQKCNLCSDAAPTDILQDYHFCDECLSHL